MTPYVDHKTFWIFYGGSWSLEVCYCGQNQRTWSYEELKGYARPHHREKLLALATKIRFHY